MNQARMHVGVDVGKDSLDICYPNGDKEHIRNTKRCRATLIKKARINFRPGTVLANALASLSYSKVRVKYTKEEASGEGEEDASGDEEA